MINNRQNGRRRGRSNGPRTPNASGPGNRQDNRQRGNAAQLHEKYKALARDAQLAGDRVQTEYYLQFADHYFRVLSEGRARFEEQRRQRDDYYASDEDYDRDDVQGDDQDGEGEEREERAPREARQDRAERGERQDRAERQDRGDRAERGERRTRRPRREERDEEQGEERISLDSLPPAIAPGNDTDEEQPAPRRRGRRPRVAEGEADIAPAA